MLFRRVSGCFSRKTEFTQLKGFVNLRGRGTGQGSRPEGRGRDLPDLGLGRSVMIVMMIIVFAASRSFYLVFQAESQLFQ